jgi:hypothetical protein
MEVLFLLMAVFFVVALAVTSFTFGVDSRPTIDDPQHNWW